jgi:glycogen(starch) synthase
MENKLKIAFISYEYPPDNGKGGIATYTQEIANLLNVNNFEVHVFSASNKRNTLENYNNIQIHWVLSENPIEFKILVLDRFREIHEKVHFNIIESPEIHGNAELIKKEFGEIPLIVRLHAPNYVVEKYKKHYLPLRVKLRYLFGALRRGRFDLGYWRKYRKIDDLDFQFTSMADYITAPSIWMKSWAVKNWGFSPEKITVFPNPFSFDSTLIDLPIIENHAHKTIVYYGRLNVLKGLFNLTKSMRDILKKHPEWKLKIIGDDGPGPFSVDISMRQWMKKQLKKVSSQVEFIDGIERKLLNQYLKNCEIVLIPSLFESFSYVCKEAMLAGKAVVGSMNGGMIDMIVNKKTGILVNPFKKIELINSLEFLIHNPELCRDISINARKDILLYENDVILNFYRNLKVIN